MNFIRMAMKTKTKTSSLIISYYYLNIDLNWLIPLLPAKIVNIWCMMYDVQMRLNKRFDSKDHIRMMECVVKWLLNWINLNNFKLKEKEEEDEENEENI